MALQRNNPNDDRIDRLSVVKGLEISLFLASTVPTRALPAPSSSHARPPTPFRAPQTKMYTSIARSPPRAASTGRAPRPSIPAIFMYTLAGKRCHDGGVARGIGPRDDENATPGLKLHFVISSVPRPVAPRRGPVPSRPIGARMAAEPRTDDPLLPRYDGSEVESGSLSSPDSCSGSQGSISCSFAGSSFVLVTGSFSCHGLPPPASASPLCPPGVRLGLRLLFSCSPFTMFSIDFNSPAELPPDARPAGVGVGEPVGGLGGGDLGLSVLLPGVTVSKAEPWDGAGRVYGAKRWPLSWWRGLARG